MEKFFKINEGTVDRILRVIAGIGLLSLTVLGPKTSWGLVGLVPLVTGLAGTCPIYTLLRLSTCPMKPSGPTSR